MERIHVLIVVQGQINVVPATIAVRDR